jgi:hypothetical protein
MDSKVVTVVSTIAYARLLRILSNDGNKLTGGNVVARFQSPSPGALEKCASIICFLRESR